MTRTGAAADKVALRAAALARRAALPESVRAAGDLARDGALAHLLAGNRVAAYVSFGTEPRTLDLLEPGYLVPLLLPDHDLDWVAYDGTLPPAGPGLGVAAVAGCDIVLVPALAVDATGGRLGRGGGSYDRALRRATGLLVALLHDGEVADRLPVQAHDVPVDVAATPTGLLALRGAGRRALGRG